MGNKTLEQVIQDNLRVMNTYEGGKQEDVVEITAQHAASLAAMTRWFKEMIKSVELPECPRRSDELTAAYCDELLEDLEL